MKKIIVLLSLLLGSVALIAQPVSQRGTTAVTVQDARLFAQYNFRPPAFPDTLQANLQIGLDSCGALIYSRDINAYYYRACNPKRWVRVASGGNTADSAYLSYRPLTDSTFLLCRVGGTRCDTIKINGKGVSTAWLIGGNVNPTPPYLGTIDTKELDIITNNVVRARIAGNGINRSSAARNRYLMIDTTARYLYYGDATGIDTLAYHTSDVLNDSTFIFCKQTGNCDTLIIGGNAWNLTGNSNAIAGISFLGTTNNIPLEFRIKNVKSGIIDSTNKNVGLGFNALKTNTPNGGLIGTYNVAIGHNALSKDTFGYQNVAIGGAAMGTLTTKGIKNTAIGYAALNQSKTPIFDVAIGHGALARDYYGYANTAIGADVSNYLPPGVGDTMSFNTMIGYASAYQKYAGTGNVFIGDSTGALNTTGNKNVFIGSKAGKNETGSNKLYISNSSTATPLIKGVFDSSKMYINGSLMIGTPLMPDSTLDVKGGARIVGLFSSNNASDSMLIVKSNGGIGYRSIPSGSITGITADNGLTANTTSNVQLGGTLLKNTTINSAGFPLTITGSVDPSQIASLQVYNYYNSASTSGIYVNSVGGGVTAFTTNNTAVYGQSVNSAGAYGVSNNNYGVVGTALGSTPAGSFESRYNSDFNSIKTVLNLNRLSYGSTPLNGIGSAIDMNTITSDGTSWLSAKFATKWNNVATSTRSSDIELYNVHNAILDRKLAINSLGKLTLDKYGIGSFIGTATYRLGVDASGNVIEDTTSGGGGSTPTLQQVLDYNHELTNGINLQGTGAGYAASLTSNVNSFGTNSTLNSAGNDINAMGSEAGMYMFNPVSDVNAFGNKAAWAYGIYGTGSNANFLGNNAGEEAYNNDINGLGASSARYNSGNDVNAMGNSSAISNQGNNVNAFGNNAGAGNAYSDVNLFGKNASATASNQIVFSGSNGAIQTVINQPSTSQTYTLPNANGTIPISVNGYTANSSGEITLPSGGTGTVTSISQGYGITNSPDPITTTGTIEIDTATLSGKYLRINDTTDMLSKYVPYEGATKTVDLNNQILKNRITYTYDGLYIRADSVNKNYIVLSHPTEKGSILLYNQNVGTAGGAYLGLRNNLTHGVVDVNLPDSSGTIALREYTLTPNDTTNKWVNSISRTPGKDSIIFYIGSTRYAIKDSVGGGGGSGTVTSVSTGYGLSGGTITNTGTLIVDTATLSGKYVPYVGAQSDVNLDTHILNAQSVAVKGTGGNGHLELRHQSSDATATGQTTALFANASGDLKWKNDGNYYTTLKTQQTADRVYTFQNKSYTLADSADVITLNGTQTISGSKTFTPLTSFSTGINVTPPTGSGASNVGVIVSGSNTNGGTSYVDFLKATNTSVGATNPNKYFRLNSTGSIETLNSSYGSVISTLTDNGTLTTLGNVNGASPTEMGYLSGVTSTIQTQINSKSNLSQAAYTMLANNTNASANMTAQTYVDKPEQAYTGTITYTGTTAPSSVVNNMYQWSQIGKTVTLLITLNYTNASSGITAVTLDLPSDCPTPYSWTGFTAANSVLYIGGYNFMTTTAPSPPAAVRNGDSYLIRNSANTGYQITTGTIGTAAARVFTFRITYRTS